MSSRSLDMLTRKQAVVLEMLLSGMHTDAIQDALGIGHSGVRHHLTVIFATYRVKNQKELKALFAPKPKVKRRVKRPEVTELTPGVGQ